MHTRIFGPQERSLAVLLRTHLGLENEKVRDAVEALVGGSNYDLFILAHEPPGVELDFGDLPKISHSVLTFQALGFDAETPQFLTFCADLLFAHAQSRRPGYRHYVIVEFDVFMQRRATRFFDDVAARLAEAADPPDLVAPWLQPGGPHWMWHAAAAAVYGEVIACFFPVVALSERAIGPLFEERLKEQARMRAEGRRLRGDGGPDDPIFCEAFAGSALKALGGFRAMDWNDLVPGAYHWEAFNTGPPRLLSQQLTTETPVEMIHPVLGAREFLEKGLHHHASVGTLPEWIQTLRSDAWPLPEALRLEFERAAQERLGVQA